MTTQEEARARLVEIQVDADEGRSLPSLRERLDLFYLAEGTTAADYEPDEEDECFCCT